MESCLNIGVTRIGNPIVVSSDRIGDGLSVTHSWNGTKLTITSASGTSTSDLAQKYSFGTSALTPGTSALESGTLYFQYE